MSTEIGKAYVQVVPSAKGISGSISNALGGEASSAGDSAGSLFGSKFMAVAGKAIAALGIGKIIGDSLEQGGALQQSIGGIETLFGAGGRSVEEYAKSVGKSIGDVQGEYNRLMQAQELALSNADQAYKTAGLSANDYMENVTGFAAALNASLGGDTLRSAEAANQAMIDMADNSNKMGTSMESIQNAYQGFAKQNYTMLDNLKLGYGGTKTEMERLLADASKISGVKYNIDNLADVYEAIHVIQTELDITGTTSKEAASTLQGSAAAMKASFSNLLGNMALGNDLTEPLNNLASSVSTWLFGNFLPMVGNIVASLPSVIGGAIQTGLPMLLENGMQLIENLKQGVVQKIPEFISQGLPMLLEFTTNLRSNFGKIVDAGLGLIGSIIDGLIKGLPQLIVYVPQIITNIAGLINDNMPKILAKGLEIVLKLGQGIIKNIPVIIANMGNIVQAIISVVGAINWLSLGSKIITLIGSGIRAIGGGLLSTVSSLFHNAMSAITNINWLSVGSNIIRGIVSGLASAGSAVKNFLISIAKGALDAVKSFFGIKSPSKVMAEQVGKWIPLGIVQGIEDNTKPLTKEMQNLSELTTASAKVDMVGLAGSNSINSTFNTDYNNNPVLQRIDAMLSLMAEYYPEMAKSGTVNGKALINAIDRGLGMAVQ